MTKSTLTPYSSKVAILASFWSSYRYDVNYEGFFYQYYDACHMAYLLTSDLMSDNTENIVRLSIIEAFDSLLDGLSIETDTGFLTLDAVMDASPNEEVESV